MIGELLPFAALGAVAGTLAGLLGIGGGIVIVPGLALLLAGGTVPPDRLMQVAVGTSLATIVVTAISSIHAHHRRGAVRWPIVARMTPGIVVGAIAGALVADALPTRTLAIAFGVFLLLVAARLAFGGQPQPHRLLPGALGLNAAGGGIGTVSSLLGIGGGTMTVPLLTWCNVPLREAVATSSACGLPIAIAGALTFAFAGADVPGMPAASTGYIHWPAFIAVAPLSMLFAPLGARIAHSVPVNVLRRGFALFVLVVGVRMLAG
jgi:uncharacterized membrane protein YfcA